MPLRQVFFNGMPVPTRLSSLIFVEFNLPAFNLKTQLQSCRHRSTSLGDHFLRNSVELLSNESLKLIDCAWTSGEDFILQVAPKEKVWHLEVRRLGWSLYRSSSSHPLSECTIQEFVNRTRVMRLAPSCWRMK